MKRTSPRTRPFHSKIVFYEENIPNDLTIP
jgi:hypothetical protein